MSAEATDEDDRTFEDDDRDKVLRIADEYGYGTVIDWLRTGWSQRLQEGCGFDQETADRATGIPDIMGGA